MPEDFALLKRNLSALTAQPRLLKRLEPIVPYGDEQLSRARSGDLNIELVGVDQLKRPLHSRHEPRAEAERLLDGSLPAAGLRQVRNFLLLGGGLGYLALALTRRLGPRDAVVYVERDLRLFRTLLGYVDLSALFERPGVLLAIGDSARELHDALIDQLQRLMSAPLTLIAHPPALQLDPEGYREFRDVVQEFITEGAVQLRTAMYLPRMTLRNQTQNLRTYLESPGYSYLKGALRGQPAILIAAGPSLRNNLELLRAVQGRVTLIAVSTSLRLLVERGIQPDFTVLIDYHRVSKRYFEGIASAAAPPMICDLKASPEALAAHRGPLLYGNDLVFNTVFDGIFGDLGEFPPGSTVAHTAFHFLRFLEADPIILVGQDLSYPGGLIHVPGTAIQTQEFPSTHRYYTLEMRELEYYYYARQKFHKVPANDGGVVPTDDVFLSYIREYERYIAEAPVRVINATEGGARIAGCDVKSLAQALEDFGGLERPDLRARIEAACAALNLEERRAKTRDLLEQRIDQISELRDSYDRMLKLLNRIVRANESGRPADRLVEKVHELRTAVREHGKIYLLLTTLAQSDLWRRLQDDRTLDAEEGQGIARQQRQAERDQRYVKGLYEAAAFLLDCLRESRDLLGATSSATITVND
ncbi:MAG: motility associated factor glycosyltransferase family protein [Planctomycetota bacterium]